MKKNRKIGYMPTGSYNRLPPEQICRSLNRIGYRAVEWTLHFASPRTHSQKQIGDLLRVSEAHDLEPSEIVVQQDLILQDENKRRDNLSLIKECIDAFSDAGVKTINLFTGPVPWEKEPLTVGRGISEGDAWGMLFQAFDELVPLAEKRGMNLAVENVWGMLCHDFYTMKHLIDHYRSPSLGVNYDASHDIVAGHTDIGWIIRSWGRDIKHVHLKDAVGVGIPDRFVFPLPGEGNVDWNAFKKALDDAGYFGPMSVEFESFAYVSRIFKGDWEKAAQLAYENFTLLFED